MTLRAVSSGWNRNKTDMFSNKQLCVAANKPVYYFHYSFISELARSRHLRAQSVQNVSAPVSSDPFFTIFAKTQKSQFIFPAL